MAITMIITIRCFFVQNVCWNTGGANELNHGFRVIVEIVAKRDSTLEPVTKIRHERIAQRDGQHQQTNIVCR